MQYKLTFSNTTIKKFTEKLVAAKASLNKAIAWRVTAHSEGDFTEWYSDAKFHVTSGGSTVGVTKDGDIISLCKNNADTMSGRELLQLAVANGGRKLDSYAGNHDFYMKCGFLPISWCKFDKAYAPSDWNGKAENIIFYVFIGRGQVSRFSADTFFQKVKPCKDYDTAGKARDSFMQFVA